MKIADTLIDQLKSNDFEFQKFLESFHLFNEKSEVSQFPLDVKFRKLFGFVQESLISRKGVFKKELVCYPIILSKYDSSAEAYDKLEKVFRLLSVEHW